MSEPRKITVNGAQREEIQWALDGPAPELAECFGEMGKTVVYVTDAERAMELMRYARGIRQDELRRQGQRAATNALSSVIRKLSRIANLPGGAS